MVPLAPPSIWHMATLHLSTRMQSSLLMSEMQIRVCNELGLNMNDIMQKAENSVRRNLFVGLQWQTPNSTVLMLMCSYVSESTNVWSIGSLAAGGNFTLHMLLTIIHVCLDSHLGVLSRDLVQ